MSIKHFHIFFISCAWILVLGFAWWCYNNFQQNHIGSYLYMALASVGFAFLLAVYFLNFLKKIQSIQ